ncbi:MAG: pyridoxamine 5'-phosphate oxidase family protein [Chloroflexota bacterium]|nr:pyridoxamine 5'-phosphate oxidase family protein [Chloroflexota bacterium]
MNIDDPAVSNVLRRSMIARIATLSRTGRPSINPLYFVYLDDHLWLGTSDWTLAARNVKFDPRVSVLFEVEQDHADRRILRISGRASVRTDQKVQRSYNLQVLRKYILTPGGIFNYLAHVRLLQAMHYYHAQSAEKGLACVIEVIPEQVEFLSSGL